MTDSSMNFGPAWIRNLRSEGTATATTGGGGGVGTGAASRYQLAEHRYGREEMLALFDKSVKPPPSLSGFSSLCSETTLIPLALLPTTEEERSWQTRPTSIGGAPRGRGGSLERGGRVSRGRGSYQTYSRTTSAYDSGWGNGEQPEWSPRKDFNSRTPMDNWRRVRNINEEDNDGWRNISTSRPIHEKWGRSTSWRGEGDSEERNGPPERGGRATWHDLNRGPPRRSWDSEDHLPEWATENPTEGGGTFDERGAFHGSDDEQPPDSRGASRKDTLQKSTSQQLISTKHHPPALSSSKSSTSLNRTEDPDRSRENSSEHDFKTDATTTNTNDRASPEQNRLKSGIPDRIDKENGTDREGGKQEDSRLKINDRQVNSNGAPHELRTTNIDRVEEEFARLQEDLVLKLVVDEETPKSTTQNAANFDVGGVQPPPNLGPPSQDRWYYQDPQGTRQGPFMNLEMAEWYKAGYFSNQLHVMRECDERYFLLGELINMCGGENPFLSGIRFPVLKNEAKLPEDLPVPPYQFLSQLAFKQQIPMRNLAEPWSALTLQQQELAAQRLLLQQQQIPHDLPYMQQSTSTNPLMYMINQMQQGNKLAGSQLVDKPASTVPNQLDPLLMQMGGLHSLQNRLQTTALHNHLPGGLPTNLSSSLPTADSISSLSGLPPASISNPGLSTLPAMHGGLPASLPRPGGASIPGAHNSIDQLPPNQDNDPISNFLKQFNQQVKQRPQLPQLDSLWQKQNQFNVPTTAPPSTQWAQQPDVPLSMWDLQGPSLPSSLPPPDSSDKSLQQQQQPPQHQQTQQQQHQSQQLPPTSQHQQQQQKQDKEKDLSRSQKEEVSQKETKKRKELEEKQLKKESEEKRKQEQRKQEAEKKAADDKKKKEEEKVRRELERAKKEAEDKRQRELEEKRRLKEQRKAEEESRKKSEELKKQEDEKARREAKEREERKQSDATRLAQNSAVKTAKVAPWCQSNSTLGMSLTDIQKAEKEKRAQETALQLKQQQLQEQQQQQLQNEKISGLQFNWAKKPVEPRKIKTLAEIQAEEQEKMAKLAAEARLAAQHKEKEAPVSGTMATIWNGQSLSWGNPTATSQWSSSASGGFWDDVPPKTTTKPSTVSKSNSTSAMTSSVKQQPPQKQPTKSKIKKEDAPRSVNNNNNNNNNPTNDEFTNWCYKTLSTISTTVDIPTFVTFLRDIESAYDVRDYCKEYLGDSPATQQFASNFLEKRRSFKPKNNAHKDDMCSPAPAITPFSQHSTEFQEVKGKNKKNKKSKMLKVDSRILGFNVTSAPDRINVGDRDYGDNS